MIGREESDFQSAAALTLRATAELARCASLLDGMEAELVARLGSSPGATDLQAVDLLDQTLHDLVACLHGLAHALPPDLMIDLRDVLASLRLADVQGRLAGRPIVPVAAAERVALF